jgi:hypothetical protein
VYGIDKGALAGFLEAGVRVVRELSALSEGELTTEVPCCGRSITIPLPEAGAEATACCCRCRVVYTAVLAEEEPDGYADEPMKVAVFTVCQVAIAVAQHRAGRWEPPRRRRGGGPQDWTSWAAP